MTTPLTPPLTVDVSSVDGRVSAEIHGDLDFRTHRMLTDVVVAHLNGSAGPVVLDLDGLAFCDSAGLAAMIRIHKRVTASGGLTVRRPRPSFMRLLEVTGLDTVFIVAA